MRKLIWIIPIAILLLATAGWGVWRLWLAPKQVACTQEAKLCPDGSYVGRQPPSCEFASCPGE